MRVAALALLLFPVAALAFDANGLKLGATEAEVKKAFPNAHCKPLEWKSQAADRRCDDAKVLFGGADARITVYLHRDAVAAFDLRFEKRDLELVGAFLRTRYGAPDAEGRETIARRGKPDRELYKIRWTKDGDQAVLTSQLERSNVTLAVWRGNFDEEIYRVR